jgi:[acyl-carrier-protein] S-malonyltransferase
MGKEMADNFPEALQVFARADQILGYPLSELCFSGPAETLNMTEYAQPALLTASLAIWEVFKKQEIVPTVMAGLSLGEYSALVAAGSLSFDQALPLVQNRARFMQAAVPPGQGGMAAILGLNLDLIHETCRQVDGIVDIANYNCPGQVVISGAREAVDEAGAALKKAGARVVPVVITVPSHSPLMRPAAENLKPYLQAVKWQEPAVPVISNVNAQANPASLLPELLTKQIYSPVLWEQSVRYMSDQVDFFIEIGLAQPCRD